MAAGNDETKNRWVAGGAQTGPTTHLLTRQLTDLAWHAGISVHCLAEPSTSCVARWLTASGRTMLRAWWRWCNTLVPLSPKGGETGHPRLGRDKTINESRVWRGLWDWWQENKHHHSLGPHIHLALLRQAHRFEDHSRLLDQNRPTPAEISAIRDHVPDLLPVLSFDTQLRALIGSAHTIAGLADIHSDSSATGGVAQTTAASVVSRPATSETGQALRAEVTMLRELLADRTQELQRLRLTKQQEPTQPVLAPGHRLHGGDIDEWFEETDAWKGLAVSVAGRMLQSLPDDGGALRARLQRLRGTSLTIHTSNKLRQDSLLLVKDCGYHLGWSNHYDAWIPTLRGQEADRLACLQQLATEQQHLRERQAHWQAAHQRLSAALANTEHQRDSLARELDQSRRARPPRAVHQSRDSVQGTVITQPPPPRPPTHGPAGGADEASDTQTDPDPEPRPSDELSLERRVAMAVKRELLTGRQRILAQPTPESVDETPQGLAVLATLWVRAVGAWPFCPGAAAYAWRLLGSLWPCLVMLDKKAAPGRLQLQQALWRSRLLAQLEQRSTRGVLALATDKMMATLQESSSLKEAAQRPIPATHPPVVDGYPQPTPAPDWLQELQQGSTEGDLSRAQTVALQQIMQRVLLDNHQATVALALPTRADDTQTQWRDHRWTTGGIMDKGLACVDRLVNSHLPLAEALDALGPFQQPRAHSWVRLVQSQHETGVSLTRIRPVQGLRVRSRNYADDDSHAAVWSLH